MKYLLLIFVLSFHFSETQAQDSSRTVKKPVVFKDKTSKKPPTITEFTHSFKLYTRGWQYAINYSRSTASSTKLNPVSNVYSLGIGSLKHAREYRGTGLMDSIPGIPAGNYVFGKINSAFPINIMAGQRRTIFHPAIYDGVEIKLEYKAGLSLAWLFPYYIVTSSYPIGVGYQEDPMAFQYPQDIAFGYTNFILSGYSKIKTGTRFETNVLCTFLNKKNKLHSVIIGGSVDFYFKPLPLMTIDDGTKTAVQLNLGYEIGKRKIKK